MASQHDPRCEEWARLHTSGGGTMTWRQIGDQYGETRETVKKRTVKWLEENGKASSVEKTPSSMPIVEFPDLLKRADGGWGKEFLRTISKVQDTMKALDTTQNVAHAVIETDLPIGICFPGDFHIGGRGTDHALFLEYVEMWQALNGALYLGMMGDYSEQFTGALARIATHQHVMTNDMQIETVMDLFVGELGEQALFWLKGNHDGWAGAELANYVMRMAQRTGKPFLGLGGELYLTVGDVEYKIAAWHRYPGASAVNKGNNQRRVRVDHNGADVVALAHLHNAYVEFAQTGDLNHVSLRCGALKVTDEHSRDAAGNVVADTRMPLVIFDPRTKDMLYYDDFRKGIFELVLRRKWWHKYPSFKVSMSQLMELVA